ncbi:MAG: type IV secretory system conjugative DNA transfer family protein, partial [Eubacterium sp.]|nr:type IV secretory system conjugative DNA transfer family protein [Eubacterium sp.]
MSGVKKSARRSAAGKNTPKSTAKKTARKKQNAIEKFIAEKMDEIKKADTKKLIILNLPFIIVWYFVDKLAWLYRVADAEQAAYKISFVAMNASDAFSNPLPSIHPYDILAGIVGGGILKAVVEYRKHNAKKFRHGVEYGSARWGTAKDIEPFVDEKPDNNIILTASESLTMSSRPKNP